MTSPPRVLDHIGITVRYYVRSKRFYEAALRPLGFALVYEEGSGGVFGAKGADDFAVREGEPSGPIHVAFAAQDRAAVDAFYEAALAAGGRDNGPPGLRPRYHPGYYGAYVLDPDGNNVEAVHHTRT